MRNPKWLRAYRQGFPVDNNIDDPTGMECPRPQCTNEVVYNGNYFCRCGWALMEVTSRSRPDHKEYADRLTNAYLERRRIDGRHT